MSTSEYIVVELSLETIQRNYMESVTDVLVDLHLEGACGATHINSIQRLFSSDLSVVVEELRVLMHQGYTMMLLGNEFNQIDQAVASNEDFVIHITTHDGKLLCAIVGAETSW